MLNSQQNLIRLQDLNFIAREGRSDTNEAKEKAKQDIIQKFAQAKIEIINFYIKTFPRSIDVICTYNKLISRKGKILFFKNQEVQGAELTCDNCLAVCKEVIEDFPKTVNTLLSALKDRITVADLEKISIKLCREFNTLTAFQECVEELQSECIAHISVKSEKTETVENLDNFSEEISIPIGKDGKDDITIGLNSTCPDAHAVIAGMSGSGKSSLLQSLILSGAYKYPPDKLQFWLLDFKDGTGLVQFEALKHVKTMSLKNRAIEANEIMDYIEAEYSKRAGRIANSGGGDIRDYNRRAKAEGKPLIPRLVIIIDEFAIMPRSCFPTFKMIAIAGRSMGMSFILSSQIIETGAAYSDAIAQANHLFEFKNSDSIFGRLVRDVTEEEKKFACSGVIGSCIYRHNNRDTHETHGTVRTLLKVAYAGGLDEQNELIKQINDKWSDYPYIKPVITGRYERIIKPVKLFECDGKRVKEKYRKEKKVFIPIGESRLGEQYLYKIDRDNPLLVVFGEETRVASVELSVIEYFKTLSNEEKAVYYVDLNCNPDRDINAVTDKYSENNDDICYVATDGGAKDVIDKVYKILLARIHLARTDRTRDIGNPIELIIHNAERISELKDEKRALKIGGITRKQPSVSADMDLEQMLSGRNQDETPGEEDDLSTLKKLYEIIEKGKNSRIYAMMYFEERSGFQNLVSDLFTYNYDFKDVLVVPRIPDEYEELSYSEVVDNLTACRLREQASAFEQTKLEQNDFICAVLVDDKVPHKIIPYEWSVEEN